ncbi:uncharacterized protein N7459_001768 [Penicillium hispanicum]|uniref:uncharacterized protein n=1 Tax=Penicillium hispanicum TaxID=1080232 RepID=UPI002541B52D|nr:uncharacterized protein N7459_001768 [Penicillium hispanicum]KAJ5595560.1 hypothetical protein N7459_001768 [Penicillium hispanicum]
MEILPGMQDVWGQLPRMKGYTHLALCFPHPESISRVTIETALAAATRRITMAVPWIGGAVVHVNVDSAGTGNFTVAQCPKTENILKIQDLSAVYSPFDDLVRAKAASDLLDGRILSAESSLPDSYAETETDPAPVLTLTASWVKGGLILDCAAQHNILDMGGIDQFFRLLATALQGQEFDRATIEANNRDRFHIFPLLRPDEGKYDHSQMRCPSSLNPTLRPPPPGPLPAFHYFRFRDTSLSQLKVSAQTPSADDALSAFIWQRLSAVRLALGQKLDAVTGFSRAIDCRRTLGVPTEYMGVVVVKTFSKMTFDNIHQSSLADLAIHLRKDLQRMRDQHFLRSLATLIAEEPDKSTINFVSGANPDTWINASSWAGATTHSLDFGLLGKAAFVRRPKSKPVQGLLYFLPKLEQGGIDVLLCLKDDEIRGLISDSEWTNFAEYIG